MKQRIKIEIEFVDNAAELNNFDSKAVWTIEIKRLLNNFDLSQVEILVEEKPE